MKIYNEFKVENLLPAMQVFLDDYRAERAFDPKQMLAAKIERINNYFEESGLNTAVIAVSGGADSALVLALLHAASKAPNSPLTRIVSVTLPALGSSGATGQDTSLERAREMCASYGIDLKELDISKFVDDVTAAIEATVGLKGSNWSKGQMVSYFRTPSLYYYTTLFTDIGDRAVLVGTTNADEGQYIGYIGKASDAMVDIQPISDLHKSEVYALAKYLGVPHSIITVPPTGDMYDGRVDEDVFGFPYAFIELYRKYLNYDAQERDAFMSALEEAGESDVFFKLSKNVEDMHRYNKHKYLGCSPAVHLDVLKTRVPKGGWKYFVYGE